MPGEDFIQSAMLRFGAGSKYFVMAQTTVNGAANSATQTFANTAGFAAGDKIYFETTAEERTILSVDSGTVVTLTASINTTNGETVLLVDHEATAQPKYISAIERLERGGPARCQALFQRLPISRNGVSVTKPPQT